MFLCRYTYYKAVINEYLVVDCCKKYTLFLGKYNKNGGFIMNEYQLISDYKQNEKYKESFNDLAKHVFELDFKGWYDRGCWNDNYICYSYVDGDKVIANTSINKMNVISNGKEYKAIQLGTVMTHPDYRHQGLATKLMNHIIKNTRRIMILYTYSRMIRC